MNHEKSQNSIKNGFGTILVLVLIGILTLAVGGTVYYQQQNIGNSDEVKTEPIQTYVSMHTDEPTPINTSLNSQKSIPANSQSDIWLPDDLPSELVTDDLFEILTGRKVNGKKSYLLIYKFTINGSETFIQKGNEFNQILLNNEWNVIEINENSCEDIQYNCNVWYTLQAESKGFRIDLRSNSPVGFSITIDFPEMADTETTLPMQIEQEILSNHKIVRVFSNDQNKQIAEIENYIPVEEGLLSKICNYVKSNNSGVGSGPKGAISFGCIGEKETIRIVGHQTPYFNSNLSYLIYSKN